MSQPLTNMQFSLGMENRKQEHQMHIAIKNGRQMIQTGMRIIQVEAQGAQVEISHIATCSHLIPAIFGKGLVNTLPHVARVGRLKVVMRHVATFSFHKVCPCISVFSTSISTIMHNPRLIISSTVPIGRIPIIVIKMNGVVVRCQFLNSYAVRLKRQHAYTGERLL